MISLNSYDIQSLVRRLPKRVVALLQSNPYKLFVAGGFIRSVIANETINDIDLFCGSRELAQQLAQQLGSGVHRKVIETDNALTVPRVRGNLSVQFIHRWTFVHPDDCIASFDFTIACAAFWWGGDHWDSLAAADFYADLAAKRLIYRSPVRNEDAGGSILRVLKFYQRGYRIPVESLAAVIARLAVAVDPKGFNTPVFSGLSPERAWAKVLTGLLREVDPIVDPNHLAHLPAAA